MILAFVCNYKYILYENGASQQRFVLRLKAVSPANNRDYDHISTFISI